MFTSMARVRPGAALVFATALLESALGPPSAVGTAAEGDEAAARLQIVVKSVHIYDDTDWGKGEMGLTAGLAEGEGEVTRFTPQIAYMKADFSANSGDDYQMGHVLPTEGDVMTAGTSPEAGIPVVAGGQYVFYADIFEKDGIFSSVDYLGEIEFPLNAGNGWGIGEHTIRSVKDGKQGNFALTFEIRRAPLPDLRPVNIKVTDLPGSTKKRVCVAVVNSEIGQAGRFEVALLVNNTALNGVRLTGVGPAPGTHEDVCAESELPGPGELQLKAVVDPGRALLEYNEVNNAYETKYTVVPPPADLTVSSIHMNGRVVDGKDDCKPGSNDVIVVVKNGGTTAAGAFAVRLTVDGVEVADVAATGLAAGQEQEVRIDDVRLKKGKRALVATVDTKGAVAESKEDNNERAATAECKGD